MLDAEFSMRDAFPAISYDEWRRLAEADLQGASFEQKLVTHTYEGIDIQPVYTRCDWPTENDPAGFPGLPPFVRGSQPLARRDRLGSSPGTRASRSQRDESGSP